MTYKIKRGSTEQEEKFLLKRTKGHPSFEQIERMEFRRFAHINQKVHTKGELVRYKEQLGKVKKVSRKGIYIQEIKEGDIAEPDKKLTFISEKEIEAGKVYPSFFPPRFLL